MILHVDMIFSNCCCFSKCFPWYFSKIYYIPLALGTTWQTQPALDEIFFFLSIFMISLRLLYCVIDIHAHINLCNALDGHMPILNTTFNTFFSLALMEALTHTAVLPPPLTQNRLPILLLGYSPTAVWVIRTASLCYLFWGD